MPDGNAILYVVGSATADSWDDRDVVVESLVTHERHVVAQGSAVRYAASGHLLVARGGAVSVVPFDPKRLRTTGSPVRVVAGVMQSALGAAQFAAARNGSFVYVAGDKSDRELAWLTRSGIATPITARPQTYWSVRVSPEGKRLALGVEGASYGVWTYDLERGTMTRLTFEGTAAYPIWTPDGARVTFNSTTAGGVLNLFWRPADGSGDQERLAASERIQIPNAWSPDGRLLLYQQGTPQTGRDLWLLSLERRNAPSSFLDSKFEEGGAAISPDGRWVAYVSTEAGLPNVYVTTFPRPSERIRVSAEGGGGPVWARSGRELFFRLRGQVFAVQVTPGARLSVGKPQLLFETQLLQSPIFQADYDVAPDGQKFVMIRPRGEQPVVKQVELATGLIPTGR
jgi:serine/threonine-protein kinase